MKNNIKIAPYFFIIALSIFMHHTCLYLTHALFFSTTLSSEEVMQLKVASGVVGLLPSLFLIAASRTFSVKTIIHTVYLFALAATFFGFFFLLPNAGDYALPKFFFQSISLGTIGSSQSELLATHWLFILYHSLISLWSSGMLILLYGYANENFSFKKALSLYPLFGVVAVAINLYAPSFAPSFGAISAEKSALWFTKNGTLLLALSGLSYLMHLALFRSSKEGVKKKDEREKEEIESELRWSYTAILGITAGFSALLIMFTRMVWDFNESFSFPSSSDYHHHFTAFTLYQSIASMMTLAILLFMSRCLKEKSAKGWRNIYFSIASVTTVLGCCFYLFNAFEKPLEEFLSSAQQTAPLHSVTMISAGYQIIISSVAYPIVLSLKEIAIVPIASSIRFTSKLVVDLIFVKGFLVIGMLTFQTSLFWSGSFSSALPFIATLFFLISLARFITIAYLGNSLEKCEKIY